MLLNFLVGISDDHRRGFGKEAYLVIIYGATGFNSA